MHIGRHWLGDLSGCDPQILRDEHALNAIFERALTEAGAHVLACTSHSFDGEGGVTGIFLLAESHASYHTYPEYSYLAVDFFTCGRCNPVMVAAAVIDALAPTSQTTRLMERTTPPSVMSQSAQTNTWPACNLKEAI